LFQGLSEKNLSEWRRVYLTVLRKSTYHSGGKRLVLKAPANSGRIPALLALFPDARFVHICRDPYQVFLSMQWVYQTVLPRAQVQKIDPDRVDAYIFKFYTMLMQKFLAEKELIPAANLVEVRFEDLEAEPLEQVRRIYERLDLPGFAQAEPAIQAYLASIAGYRKNEYQLTNEIIAKVNQHWGFAFEAWGYPRL
jgi:hypothetical protein